MLIVAGDLVELILERSHAGDAVDKLEGPNRPLARAVAARQIGCLQGVVPSSLLPWLRQHPFGEIQALLHLAHVCPQVVHLELKLLQS